MSEEDKDILRQKKKEVTEYLLSLDLEKYHLAVVDPRLESYVSEVIMHPEGHNLWEQLALKRFFDMYRRYGINVSAVYEFVALYENLYFPSKRGKSKFKLTPVQYFQYTNIFGFWHDGKRVVREALLFVPRKFSKTTSSAAISVWDVLYGDANAESYIAANSADQAKKCFNVIRGCFQKIDPKMRLYQINEQIVKSKRADREAFAQCLTANARTKDGLNASSVIVDEWSQADDNNLVTVLTTSMGVRDNPLTVFITTASDKLDGPCARAVDGYKEVLMGTYEDDSTFIHIFEPDVDDDEGDERTWFKVQPHMGVTVQPDWYRHEWAKAQRNAEDKLAFRTKLLNVFAENETKSWISGTLARKISVPFSLDNLKGRPSAMCAIDLSESDDFSAVCIGIYDKMMKRFYFHVAYFFPRGALEGHANENLYRVWAERGYLHLTKGDVIDYKEIVNYIIGASKKVTLLGIGYDPWKSQDVINMLAATGGNDFITPVRQTYGAFTAPVESFEHRAKTGDLFINDNPINAYCFSNAILDEDRLENLKPIKRARDQKIDGVITMLMCMRLFIDFKR